MDFGLKQEKCSRCGKPTSTLGVATPPHKPEENGDSSFLETVREPVCDAELGLFREMYESQGYVVHFEPIRESGESR